MKVLLIIALGLVALTAARPSDDIVDFDIENHSQEQEGTPGRSVKGEYSWTAPNGEEFFVKYVADSRGFRVVDDNVVPVVPESRIPNNDGDEDAGEGDDN